MPLLSQFHIHFHRSPATFTLHWTPPVSTTLSPHPVGSLELAVGPYHHHGHQWLWCTVRSTWHALAAIFMTKVSSSHSPQGCLAWACPAHLFDSLSASETGPRLLPYPLGQGDQKKRCVQQQAKTSTRMSAVFQIWKREKGGAIYSIMEEGVE